MCACPWLDLWIGGDAAGAFCMLSRLCASAGGAMAEASMLAEAPVLWKNGWPTTLAKLAEFVPTTMLLFLVGPLGPEAVAVAGMGSFWVNVTGVSMVMGFGIGMIPLAAQAYGARNYERVGIILVRQQCIHLLVSTGVLVLWWNTENALNALDQPPFIASGTAEFVRWRMPALPFLVLNQNFSSFLQCQRVFKPMMYVGIVVRPPATARTACAARSRRPPATVTYRYRYDPLGWCRARCGVPIASADYR